MTRYPVYPVVHLVTVHRLPQSTASTSSSPSSPIDAFTWRALVPQETDLADRLQKLPERFVAVLQSENSEGRAAQERGDWKTAMAKFETCRTMISEDLRRLVPMHVEEQDFDLLLAWADLPLAELYQSRGSSDSFMLKKAMEMRKEVLRCVIWIRGSSFWPRGDDPLPTNNGIGSTLGDLLVQVCVTYYYTAQYEWGRAVNNELARTEAVQKFADFVGCGDDEAESQLCLLLSVDYQYLGRFEVGLEWIEEADRHWPQISPGVDEYRRILRLSKAELEGSEPDELNGTAEKLPSTFGCIRAHKDDARKIMLVQSPVGLEHHLPKLPVPLHVAFRWHGNRGSSFLKNHQWEAAIFEFEWCREILKIVRGMRDSKVEQVKACDWLMVWASVPLAGMYEFWKNQIKKALYLWYEIAEIIRAVDLPCPTTSDDVATRQSALFLLYVGRYHYSVSEYKENRAAKDEAVIEFGDVIRILNGVSLGEVDDLLTTWFSESLLLTFLYESFVTCGNDEAALPFISQAKQLFDGQHFSGKEGLRHLDIYFGHVRSEAGCLFRLHRFEDAATVMDNYKNRFDNPQNLPEKVERTLEEAKKSAQYLRALNNKSGGGPVLQKPHNMGLESGIEQLRKKGVELAQNGEWKKAVECYELIDKTPNEGLEGAVDCKFEAWDYYVRGQWLSAWIHDTTTVSDPVLEPECSYEQIKAYHQDVNLLRAVQYYKKVAELSSPYMLKLSADLNTSMASLYDRIDGAYAIQVVRRYGKTVDDFLSSVHKGDSVPVRVPVPVPVRDAINEIEFFLKLDSPVDKYGKQAVRQYVSLLYDMGSSSYIEDWAIRALEDHNILFKALREHHYRRFHCFTYMKDFGADCQEQMETSGWNAFLYAEAERAQIMLYQQLVASNKLNSSQQWGHHARNIHTPEDIRELCAAVRKGPSVYVQYSSLIPSHHDSSLIPSHHGFYIYVIDQDGELNILPKMIRTPGREGEEKPRSLETILKELYRYLEKHGNYNRNCGKYNRDSMKKDLMFLHDLLIKPIADILKKMKPEDNLILCPSELFSKVPFAALQDSESPHQYLIERHTISLVPSLRILHSCNERLEELQSSHSYTGDTGSIIALGDPEYCKACGNKFQPLPGTRDEVEHISTLFGKSVKKLLGRDATKEHLRVWAAIASGDSNCFRQPIVHIGAHGRINNKHGIVNLHLSCDEPASSANIGALPLSDATSSSHEESKSERLGKRHWVESDDDSDEDRIDSDDEESGVTSFQATSQSASSSRSRARNGRNASTEQQTVASHALKMEDISRFQWRAELVVLSACRSGTGRIRTEGVLSFARAFMIAGVPCVVASQWKVDDKATVALMEDFYKELRQGKDVASALRSSMLTSMRTNRDLVAHWAPFNVWGASSMCLPQGLLDPQQMVAKK